MKKCHKTSIIGEVKTRKPVTFVRIQVKSRRIAVRKYGTKIGAKGLVPIGIQETAVRNLDNEIWEIKIFFHRNNYNEAESDRKYD